MNSLTDPKEMTWPMVIFVWGELLTLTTWVPGILICDLWPVKLTTLTTKVGSVADRYVDADICSDDWPVVKIRTDVLK